MCSGAHSNDGVRRVTKTCTLTLAVQHDDDDDEDGDNNDDEDNGEADDDGDSDFAPAPLNRGQCPPKEKFATQLLNSKTIVYSGDNGNDKDVNGSRNGDFYHLEKLVIQLLRQHRQATKLQDKTRW